MVKKLRKKFVITATLSLLAILVVMIAIINFSNILSNIREADHLLSILSTNDGHFPQTHPPKENRPMEVSDFGITTPVSSPHSSKAQSPTEVTEPGIVSVPVFLAGHIIKTVLSLSYSTPS